MTNDTLVQAIARMAESVVADDTSYFLVDVKIKPTNNIKVFLDGDTGISISKCADVNRALYKDLEESNLFPDGNFSLEVSSPGLDEPLKLPRQYKKNVGRYVEVVTLEGAKVEGKLIEVNDGSILVEEEKGKNKKRELIRHTLQNIDIKSTKIQIKF